MGYKHVKAKSAKSARRKATSKRMTVTKVNYMKGSKSKGGMKTYGVYTRPKIKHTKAGWAKDRKEKSNEKWEKRYRRKKR